jgi:drug/metabolite transporter (DMT)-like permease
MDLDRPSALILAAALLLGILSLGMSGILVRWAEAPGTVTSFYRMSISATLLAGPFLRRVRREDPSARGVLIAILAGLFFAADLGLWASGVVMSGATIPTLMANTAPLWVGLGAMVLLRQHLKIRFWIGLALALAGAIVVLGQDLQGGSSLDLGSLMGLMAGFFYGGYYLVLQRGRAYLGALTSFWIAAATSALALLGVMAVLEQPLFGYSTLTYLSFLGIGLITQTFGYLAITYSLGHLPASLVAPTMLGQPVVTALLAWPLLGERLSAQQILGGLGVLGGIYLVSRGQRRLTRGPRGAAAD